MAQVFLSYAHDDNAVPAEGFIGWVHFFDTTLNIDLAERGLKERVTVRRDVRDLRPMDALDDALKQMVAASDILLAVLSPLYVQRPYCKLELEAFLTAKGGQGDNSGAEPVLAVVKWPLRREEECPPPIRNKVGVHFFEIDRVTQRPRPFYEGFGKDIKLQYWEAVRKVGEAIQEAVERLASTSADAPPRPPASRPRATIFLAQPTDDVDDAYHAVRREIESLGCRVVPEAPLPTDDALAAAGRIREALAEADLSVHLLGATAGFTPHGGGAPIVRLQVELAGERSTERTGFKRFIWRSPDLRPADEGQRALLDDLERDPFTTRHDEVVRAPLQVFLDAVRDALPEGGASPPGGPACVYLVYAQEDEDDPALDVLCDALHAAGHGVRCPSFGADTAEHNRRQLETCDAALVFWGKASLETVAARLSELTEARDHARPFRARGLILAEPLHGSKRRFRTPEVDVILQPAGDTAAALAPFLNLLESGGSVRRNG